MMANLTPQQKKARGFLLTPKDKRQIKYESLKEQLESQYGRKLNKMQIRYLEKGIRYQLIYDIETSDFNPYQNFMICFVAYRRDIVKNKITKHVEAITKADITKAVKDNNFNFDYVLLQKLSELMKQCDQVCGHFSTKFDTPFFRSRCLLTNQEELIPDYMDNMSADTWRMMKQTMKAPRNTLNNLILQATGKSDKTHVDLEYWYKVRFKDSPDWQKAMGYIVDHCKKDVAMTYKALQKIERFNNVSGGYV